MTKMKIFGFTAAVFVGLSAFTLNNDKYFEIIKNIEIFTNVYKQINTHYVDELDPSQLMRTGIDAMLESLDPYTNYISEAQVQNYRISRDGQYDGIGALSKEMDGKVTVMEVYEGGAAIKAGLLPGDQILSINGKSTEGKSNDDVVQIMRGFPGSEVSITVSSILDNVPRKLTLERGKVQIPNVPYQGMVSDNVGYVSLTTFTADASRNISQGIIALKKDNPEMTGLILDLRNNGGGLLREAIAVSNIFIPKGIEIVSTKSKVKERDQSYKTMAAPLDLDIPLVVLVNKSSASASEIVSGVIQDLDRGVIMGQRSFGKGLVQNTHEVGYNSRVKVTTSKYYIPSGRCIQGLEYEDGVPVDIPDSERAVFYTKNKRKVLDGGGIAPDVKLELVKDPAIVSSLKKDNWIFKYVTSYVKDKKDIGDAKDYSYGDYADFTSFLDREGFEYKTESERELEELEEDAKKELLHPEIADGLGTLKSKITAAKADDLTQYQSLVEREIEQAIVTRFHYQKGKVAYQLNNDAEVEEAIALLNDKARYDSLLK